MKAFLQATHGFHIRNLLDSRLLGLLAAQFDIVILANCADAAFLAADYANERVTVESVRIRPRRIEPWLEFVRKRVVVKPSRALTVSVFSARERQTRPGRHAILRLVNSIAGRWQPVRRAWLALERLLVPGHEFDFLFERHRPAIVICGNYGTDPESIRLLRAAARFDVPSVTIVPSFDNLTSKGVIGAPSTRMIVWNETMRSEATQLHDIPADAVAACGPVQFDIYADPLRWPRKEQVWSSLGLNVDHPTVVVGTITPVYFPYNLEVIELIAEAIIEGQLPRDTQVLVRLHPQVVRDSVYGDNLDAYVKLADRYPFVKLNIPDVRRWGTLTPPARDDMAFLAALLAHAAAVVVPASTLAIDAASVGTPVVGIAFDGRQNVPPELSVARYYDFTHYLPVTKSGAVSVVRSASAMIEALSRALQDRATNEAGRRRLIKTLVGEHDGRAAERIVAEVRVTAKRSQAPDRP